MNRLTDNISDVLRSYEKNTTEDGDLVYRYAKALEFMIKHKDVKLTLDMELSLIRILEEPVFPKYKSRKPF